MFILTTISDLVQISPEDFRKPSVEALEDNINAKYANKVIHKVGLCICLYDMLKVSEGLIGHGTGLVNVNVEFRVIVFRPFKGEIILGKISSSSEQGIKIRLDFFNDIFIPGDLLFPESRFDPIEQVWIWDSEGTQYYFDKNEPVYFRVESEEWNDQSPSGPNVSDLGAGTVTVMDRTVPYCIQGSMAQSGLGVCSWW
ncbi:MAG: DNA-directed RNA polymerase III subunit rpc25 [Lichina confinis]|nr:MAG: DNA-directed RNA polymerase III subunit rpc25 [Lichina confinis]